MATAFRDTLPGELVTHVTAICGTRGDEWLERLPQTIDELEAEWSISVGDPFPGIEFNFVAPATMDSRPVVLKLAPPFERTEIYAEAKYLKFRNGEGAVRFITEDRDRHAFLMERAFPGEALFKRFDGEPANSVRPAIDALRTILRPPPDDLDDVQSLDGWFENFRGSLESEFPRQYAEKALDIYERLSGQQGRTFYLHGDYHPGNIVTSDRAPFLAIDPKGIVGHIGYDLSVFLNNLQWWCKDRPDLHDLLKYAVREFAVAFGMTERNVREWAFAYMVIGAWWTFDEMPEHFNTNFAEIDVWDV